MSKPKLTKTKAIWAEYDRLGDKIIENRIRMRYADRAEQRRLIRENHDLMVKMDELTR